MADNLDKALSPRDYVRGQLEPTDKGIDPPTNIITNVVGARALFHKYRMEHIKRIQLYSLIEGLISGNPPYSPGELLKAGLGHIANFNTLEGRSLWKKACLAYWNLLNEAETICKFTINNDAVEARAFEDIMSKEWDFVVRKWPSFETQMGTLSGQLVKFGISPVLFPDERDWRWRVVELSKFFVPDQAQSDLELLTAVCVETMFTAQYLFQVYETFKDSKKEDTPWDIEELKQLLLSIANTFSKTNYEFVDFMDLQKRMQNGDIGYDVIFSDSIRIVSLFYQEYDGKFSHYMFHRTFDKGEFLYFADRQYETLNDAMVILTGSPGEYTIHSNRGLGHEIFAPCQANNQLVCSIVDGSRWAATPLIRGVATGAKDIEQIRFTPGVPTNIGMAEFVQNNIGSNINQLIGTTNYVSALMQRNVANSGDDPSQPDANVGSISPSQARMQSFKEFGVLKNNIAHFYKNFDFVIMNMVKKMLNSKDGDPGYEYVKEWKDRCISQGVPEEIFASEPKSPWGMPRQLDVKATRVAGDGSTLARLMGLQELMQIAGDFGPRESKEFKRQYIMATMGKEYVGSFMNPTDDSDSTAGGASLAACENGLMQNGQAPVFSKDNDHRAHFETHMALATHTIQNITQQQMTPIEADKIFTVLAPHLQEHFGAVAKSPFSRTYTAQYKKSVDQILQYANLNRQKAAQMMQAQMKQQQEAQQAQQQAMSEEQIKMMQAQNDERRKDLKVQSQVARAKDANVTRGQVMMSKVQSDAEIQKTKVKNEADNQRLKVELEAETKQRQTSHKMGLDAQKAEQENSQALAEMQGEDARPFNVEVPDQTPII